MMFDNMFQGTCYIARKIYTGKNSSSWGDPIFGSVAKNLELE
jgi:hypothetical protein